MAELAKTKRRNGCKTVSVEWTKMETASSRKLKSKRWQLVAASVLMEQVDQAVVAVVQGEFVRGGQIGTNRDIASNSLESFLSPLPSRFAGGREGESVRRRERKNSDRQTQSLQKLV